MEEDYWDFEGRRNHDWLWRRLVCLECAERAARLVRTTWQEGVHAPGSGSELPW